MTNIVLNAINTLKDDIANKRYNKSRAIQYLNYADLEKKYTPDKINEINREFVNQVQAYLSNHYPNKFCIWSEQKTIYIGTYDFLNNYIDNADKFLIKGNN